ncbi:MAG TPA: aminodeoxychorismate synthase component I [Rhizomicrobium sp.]|nr:aminodeoxychorismate synthase component I [Rhizomicrobium sp.]
MLVLLDGVVRQAFAQPRQVIRADHAAEVPAALAAAQTALAEGRYVAGWLGYELGYVLEPRLAGPEAASAPLLRLGVFDGPSEAPPAAGRAYAGPLTPEWNAADYGARFAAVKDYIAAGDIYQANLSFRARFPFLGEPRTLYEQLLAASGAGHCGYVDDGERQILSLSPELFFDLSRDSLLTVRPMKGTAPRLGDDTAEREALAASAKNRAENLMIVDLIRNDLSRIAEKGSVEVSDLFQVETYPTLHTMVSTVTARGCAGIGIADILRALFPCGSVTGAPKIRAMEILRQLESSPRGAYCGAVGCFAPAPDNQFSARFNVAIRTLTICGGQGEMGIGGGVVQDSQEDSEYAECLLKARFFEAARKPLELIETLRWDNGFVRLDGHMKRMEGSARVLGLPYDSCSARIALQHAVTGRSSPLRVRLTLDEQGTHHATAHELGGDPSHWTYAISPQRTDSDDALLRHKTNWRELYESEAMRLATDEVIFCNERGELTEGARSNIFIRQGDTLLTPPLTAGVLDGRLRAELIEQGKACEATLMPEDLNGEVWFGNSLRGLIPARRS